MNQEEVIASLSRSGVVAVIRAPSAEEAKKLGRAAAKGGIGGLEIAFTTPQAEKAIHQLAEEEDGSYLVGAGTVLEEETARLAIDSGAHFIVSPSFDAGVASYCASRGVPYIPGCLTPTEVREAMKSGVPLIKIFPGSLTGPSYLKALHGPFPKAKFMPSGGVSVANVGDWVKSGAVAVSAGGSLTAPGERGDYEGVTKIASEMVAALRAAKANR